MSRAIVKTISAKICGQSCHFSDWCWGSNGQSCHFDHQSHYFDYRCQVSMVETAIPTTKVIALTTGARFWWLEPLLQWPMPRVQSLELLFRWSVLAVDHWRHDSGDRCWRSDNQSLCFGHRSWRFGHRKHCPVTGVGGSITEVVVLAIGVGSLVTKDIALTAIAKATI